MVHTPEAPEEQILMSSFLNGSFVLPAGAKDVRQTYYFFAQPIEVPAGAKIVSTACYDNSASNPHNPDATKEVRWGDQTWEEMQFTGFLYSVNSRRRAASR
jgi:hypothetical protein